VAVAGALYVTSAPASSHLRGVELLAFSAMSHCCSSCSTSGPHRLQLPQSFAHRCCCPRQRSKAPSAGRPDTRPSRPRRRRIHKQSARIRARLGSGGQDQLEFALLISISLLGSGGHGAPLRLAARPLSLSRPGRSAFAGFRSESAVSLSLYYSACSGSRESHCL